MHLIAYVIAQLTDLHIGGLNAPGGPNLSAAIDEINAMTLTPDLVLLTGDLTHDSTAEQWIELRDRLDALRVPWAAIKGNHDRTTSDVEEFAHLHGHRSVTAGPLRLVLVDSSNDEFGPADGEWLDNELGKLRAVGQPFDVKRSIR
jgi:3',5'-cyclic-AMP phosphodiesterase